MLTQFIENQQYGEGLIQLVKEKIEEYKMIIECYQLQNNQLISDMLKDLEGQIMEGVESESNYRKWSQDYYRSLREGYRNQLCNNFKDFGIQLSQPWASPLDSRKTPPIRSRRL